MAPALGARPAGAQTPAPADVVFRETFEAGFVPDTFCAAGTCQVPAGWEVWWVPRRETDPEGLNFQPQAARISALGRVQTGQGAQRLFVERAAFTGGVRRVISGIKVGTRLRVSAAMQVWSTNDEASFSARPSKDVRLRIGVEPLTGDPKSASAFNPGVIWSPETDVKDRFNTLTLEFEARTSSIVIYTYATMKDPVRHNEVFIDDVVVETVAGIATPDPLRSANSPGIAAAATVTGSLPVTATVAAPALTLTPAPTAARPASGKTYKVESGDTLSGIAAKTGVGVDDLRRLNGLRTDLLTVGQELLLEAPPAPPTATPRPPGPGTAVAAAPQFGLLCVEAFFDNDGDGKRQADKGENLVPNVFFSISAAGQLVSTRTTDGINEPFCVQNLATGSYIVGATTLQAFNATTPLNDTKVVQGGSATTFSVGLRPKSAGNAPIVPTAIAAQAGNRELSNLALPILAVGIGALLVVGGVFFALSYFLKQRRI